MAFKWNDAAERQLLLAIIDCKNITLIDWSAVGVVLTKWGYDFSTRAIRERYFKIKRAHSSADNYSMSTVGMTSTPQKRRMDGTAGGGSTPRSGRSNKAFGGIMPSRARWDEEDDDEEGGDGHGDVKFEVRGCVEESPLGNRKGKGKRIKREVDVSGSGGGRRISGVSRIKWEPVNGVIDLESKVEEEDK